MTAPGLGFIGLGNMGLPMARRLAAAGHALVVHDSNASVRAAAEAFGAVWAATPRELASRAATVLVSLPTPAIVEQVLLGADGVIEGGAVRIVVDLSTTGPATAIAIGQRLRERGIDLIDAPVSGGTTGAADGSLTLMCSGPETALASVLPVLNGLGNKLFNLGVQPGQGQLMKVINNTLCAAAALASFEGLVLGVKGGMDAATMLDVLNASSGRSFATEVKIPQCVLDRSFPHRFSTALLHKDVTLCLDEGARLGVTMAMGDQVRHLLGIAISQGDGPLDYGNVIKRLEAGAGVEVGRSAASQ